MYISPKALWQSLLAESRDPICIVWLLSAFIPASSRCRPAQTCKMESRWHPPEPRVLCHRSKQRILPVVHKGSTRGVTSVTKQRGYKGFNYLPSELCNHAASFQIYPAVSAKGKVTGVNTGPPRAVARGTSGR